MSKDSLIDAHVSSEQCKTAIDALRNHAHKVAKARDENELLPAKEEFVWLVLTVKKTYPEKKVKPFKIPLAHPLVDPRTTPICLITKDPQREYKDLLEAHSIKFISRVVGITKLKGKFKPFEARRLLLKENGLFLADDRVVPLLPGLLGKKFFEAKKQPIPVCLTRKNLKAELEHAIASTYMHQNQGTCSSIKIGTVTQKPTELLSNLKSVLPAIVAHVKGGWDNIQSFNIKTNSSVSLPIWSCDLGIGMGARWGVEDVEGTGNPDNDAPSIAEEDSMDMVEESPKKIKGKKRGAEEQSATPAKKVKATKEDALVPSSKPPKEAVRSSASAVSKSNLTRRKSVSGSSSAPHFSPLSQLSPKTKSKKSKTEPDAAAAAPSSSAAPAMSALTTEELKQKRTAMGLEKNLKVKDRTGKSKESIIGKAAKFRS